MGKQVSNFFSVRPEVPLNLGENQHSVDFDFKGSMPGEVNKLLFDFIVISFHLSSLRSVPAPVFGVVFWRFVLSDGKILNDGLGFVGNTMEKVLILFFIMSRAPLMEMAINAMFNLKHDQWT